MKKILVEGKYTHGAIIQNRFLTKLKRSLRPKAHKLGMATQPFDFSKGAGILAKTGKLTIEGQGSSNSCGGQAKKRLMEIKRKLQGINERLSAKSMYGQIRYQPNGGTTVSALEKDLGATTEQEVPSYFAGGQAPDETFMQDLSWKNPTTTQSLATRTGYIPITVSLDIDSVAQAIAHYGAVIILIRGQNNGTWLSQFPKPPLTENNEIWAHFMCSEDVPASTTPRIDCYQSWGPDVGVGGIQSFTAEYFNSGFITDVIAFDTKQSITQQKISLIEKLLMLYQMWLKMVS